MKQSTCLMILALLVGTATTAESQGLFSYNYEVLSIGNEVNSSANDYAPFLSGDRQLLWFTSYRKDQSLGQADIFAAKAKPGSGGWTNVVNPGSPLNSPKNEGSISVSGDGKTVVLASDGSENGVGDTDILIGELAFGRINNVRNIGSVVNSRYWDSQPVISKDGKMIYFASNRKGGFGGTDIYETHLVGNAWSEPTNLGPTINTKKNERSPYVTPDGGSLYFSSEGFAGFGGYDIYYTRKNAVEWDQASNLGSQINSSADELFFVAPSKFDRFYFASNRDGGAGELDIYYGTPNVFGEGMFSLIVNVLDSTTMSPIPATVNVIDVQRGDTVATFYTNTQNKDYEQLLPAERPYKVVSQIANLSTRSADVSGGAASSTRKVELIYGGVSLAEFNLGKYNVPFFVTGYYRPNTPENLEELLLLREGRLAEANYIERFKKGSKKYELYRTYADAIASILGTVRNVALEEVFPRFKSGAASDETLVITITGYADPQPFVGTYVESESVTFENGRTRTPMTVVQGSQIENMELSGLRAWYAGRELDRMLREGAERSFPDYSDMVKSGRIVFRYVGGGESRDSKNYAAQRRIHIAMSRSIGGQPGTEDIDFNTRLK